MRKNVVLLSGIILMMAACADESSGDRKDGYSEKAKTTEDSLFQEVMDGHDKAMAKMGKIAGYRKQVTQQLDSLKKVKSGSKKELNRSLEELQASLKSAEDGMNVWMQEFQIDSAQDDAQRRLKYLSDEKVKVEKVRDDIFSALERADSLLKR